MEPEPAPSGAPFAASRFSKLELRAGKYLKAHHITRAGLVVGACAAALFFFFVGAVVRLLIGPVSLGPFSSALSSALAEAMPGVSIKYDQAAVEWSRDEGRLELVILGARVFDPQGRIIAQAPKASVDLVARSVLSGRPELKRITLIGVQLTLVRTPDGHLRLGVGRDASGRDLFSNITDIITARNSRSSTLTAFAVHDAHIAMFDRVTGLFVIAPRADMTIETRGENLASLLDADIDISGRRAHVHGDLLSPPGAGPVTGDVAISGLDLEALADNAKLFRILKDVALKIDMSASFSIAQGARLSFADFGLNAKGMAKFAFLGSKPVQVSSARVVGRYDGPSGRLLIDDAHLKSDAAEMHLVGGADFKYDNHSLLSEVDIETISDAIKLKLPGVLQGPVAFRHFAFRGAYLPSTRDIVLDHLGLSGGPFSTDLSGKVTLAPSGAPALELKGTIPAMAVKDFLRYWPLTVASGGRAWADKNLYAGSVGPVLFETNLPSGALDQPTLPDQSVHVQFPLAAVEANYLTGLTHLSQVNATVILTGNTFSAAVSTARIGALQVTKGHFQIPVLSAPAAPADITGHVEGSMGDLLALLDQKPLNYPTRFGINSADTKGSIILDLSTRLPMVKNLSMDKVTLGVKAHVTGLDIAVGPHWRLTEGTIDCNADGNGLAAAGSARLAGSQLALDWKEDFRSSQLGSTQITAKGTIDDAARSALGIGVAQYLSGPVVMTATLTGAHGHLAHADLALDLTEAGVSFDLMGIRKPVGIAGTGHVAAELGPNSQIAAENIHFSSVGGAFDAHVAYAPDGSLQSFELPEVKYAPSDDFSFRLAKESGVTNVTIRGRSLDGSLIAHEGSETRVVAQPAVDDPTKDNFFDGPFHVTVKLDRLVLRDSVAVAPLSFDATGDGAKLSALALSGSLGHGMTVTGNVAGGAKRHADFATDDAGTLARGLFGLTSLHGGRLELTVTFPAGDADGSDPSLPDFEGTLTLRNATLSNQPFVARLLSMASFAGIVTMLSGSGLAVDQVDVPFSSKNGIISVHDAAARGPTIGMTADGYVDRPENQVAMMGSIVPVVGLDFNRVLGAIPIVGNILVGKKGEGILGVTYSMKGSADQPEVSVNPLAMLTPGILRRVFEGRVPTAPVRPSKPAQKTAPALTTLDSKEAAVPSAKPKSP